MAKWVSVTVTLWRSQEGSQQGHDAVELMFLEGCCCMQGHRQEAGHRFQQHRQRGLDWGSGREGKQELRLTAPSREQQARGRNLLAPQGTLMGTMASGKLGLEERHCGTLSPPEMAREAGWGQERQQLRVSV